jgi:hypothetical protein
MLKDSSFKKIRESRKKYKQGVRVHRVELKT